MVQPVIEMIAPENLHYPGRDVQRDYQQSNAEKIKREFKPDGVGILLVSQRDDGLHYVIDGWHRRNALIDLGRGSVPVSCEVKQNLTLAEEAALFRERNNNSPVRIVDKFRVRITEGEPIAVAIQDLVEAAGLKIGENSVDGIVSAVGSLEKIYKRGKVPGAVLARTLDVLTRAYGHVSIAMNGDIIFAVGRVIDAYPDVSIDHLAARLAEFSGGARGLLGKGRGVKELRGGSLSSALADVIVTTYNKGRRSGKLAAWRQ